MKESLMQDFSNSQNEENSPEFNQNANKKEKIKCVLMLILMIVSALLLIALIVMIVLYATKDNEQDQEKQQEVQLKQTGHSPSCTITWKTTAVPDIVLITVKNSKGVIQKNYTITDETTRKAGTVTINGIYGKNDVEVHTITDCLIETSSYSFDVYADEYVIAPLIATMPVTLFVLQLKEITKDYSLPTLIWLERGEAFDYNELPPNMDLIPFGDERMKISNTAINSQKLITEETQKWVA